MSGALMTNVKRRSLKPRQRAARCAVRRSSLPPVKQHVVRAGKRRERVGADTSSRQHRRCDRGALAHAPDQIVADRLGGEVGDERAGS
jgi:hypothetical protein